MGKIYTWREIEQNEVPTKQDLEDVQAEIIARLKSARSVLGAQICGSLARGDYTLRSDIDVVVVYRSLQEEKMMALFQELNAYATARHVPLELIVIDAQSAQTADHTFTPSFMEHMRLSAGFDGTTVKRAPHTLIEPSGISLVDDARSYIRNKMRTFRKRWVQLPTMTEHERARALQKYIEFPIYSARKVLRALGHELTNDSKDEVRRACKRSWLSSQHSYIRSMCHLDECITRDLRYCMEEGHTWKRCYESDVHDIEINIGAVLAYAFNCLVILREHAT